MSANMSEATAEKYPNISEVFKTSGDMNAARDFLKLLRPIDQDRAAAAKVESGTEEMWKLLKNNLAMLLNPALNEEKTFRDVVTGYVVKVKRQEKEGSLNHAKFALGVKQMAAPLGFDDVTIDTIIELINIKVAYRYVVMSYLGFTEEQFESLWQSAYEPKTDMYYSVRLYNYGTPPAVEGDPGNKVIPISPVMTGTFPVDPTKTAGPVISNTQLQQWQDPHKYREPALPAGIPAPPIPIRTSAAVPPTMTIVEQAPATPIIINNIAVQTPVQTPAPATPETATPKRPVLGRMPSRKF